MKTENLETINDTRSGYRSWSSCELQKKSMHLIHASPHLARPTIVSAHLYLVRLLLFRCYTPMSPFTLQGVLCCGRLSEQLILLTGYEHTSFIESAANTLRLIHFRDRAVSTTTFTTSRPLWMHLKFTTTQIGQLTSPLFSQEREVSANPFCVSCSQTHSNVEKSRQDVDPFSSVEKARLGVEPFSRFEKLLSKGKEIENCRVSKILKWKGNQFCPNKCIHDFLEKKADRAHFSQDYLKRNLIWTEEWRMRNADIALCEIGMQLQPGGWNLYQAHPLSDQPQREKGWLCEDLEKRNRAFQEDRAGDCQETQELRRICCAEADRARQLKYDEPSTQKEDNPSAVNQFMVQIQELQDKVNSLTDAKEFHDPETASSTGLSSFIVNPWVFRVPEEWWAVIPKELVEVLQETLSEVYLFAVNHPQHSSTIHRIWLRLLADWGQLRQATLRNREKEWHTNRWIILNTHSTFCQDAFDLEPSVSYKRHWFHKFDGKPEEWGLGLVFR